MRTVRLLSGRRMPVLGQGTWRMGEVPSDRETEVEALRLGIDLGMTLIDTAEMYGDGQAERVVAEAIGDRRREIFLVSKVLPHHATIKGTIQACEASLSRLETDYLDLYLLHWRESYPPLEETLDAFQALKQRGLILDYGVSNFDLDDMLDAFSLPGGSEIVTDQVMYNLKHRGIEWDLMPWCRDHNLPIMAYSPIEHAPHDQRGMLDHPAILDIAARLGATPAQIALAWLLHQDGVVAIPKASRPEHVRENRAAVEIKLSDEDLEALDAAFPRPESKVPLAVR